MKDRNNLITTGAMRVLLLLSIIFGASCDKAANQSSLDELKRGPKDPIGVSSPPVRGGMIVSEELNADALAEQALHDPSAARQLHGLFMLCEGLSSRGTSTPEWERYKRMCDRSTSARSQLVRATTGGQSADWTRLAALSELPEDDETREEGLKQLLRTSRDIELRMSVAAAYATSSHLKDWAESASPSSLHSYPVGLQIDAALLYGCQIGLDCSPSALFTLGECSVTQPCRPGANLQEVVEIRRSPQEMQLIQTAVARLVDMSR